MSAEDDRNLKSTGPEDRRDHAVDAAWREASQEEPSRGLDARILAAARAAVDVEAQAHPRRREPAGRNVLQRWQPLLAAAAVAGLAFVLVPMTMSPPTMERATEPATAPAMESADTTPADDGGVTEGPRAADEGGAERMMPGELPAERAPVAPRRAPAPVSQPQVSKAMPDIPPPPATTSSRAPPEPPSVDSSPAGSTPSSSFGAVTSTATRPDAQRAERAGSRDEAAAAAPAPQVREKQVAEPAPSDVHAWVERIEAAYRAGDRETAAAHLRAFRAADPAADDHLPEELRDWARTVD
jgi:hypothetical protein